MKPSIAELLKTAGYDTFTPELVKQASQLLYGNVGAGLDQRDWSFILASSDPFAVASQGLQSLYRDQAFLLENAQHLLDKGYSPAQIENTYRQMQERLGYDYTSKEWAKGTLFEDETLLSDSELTSQLQRENRPPTPADTTSLTASNFTATATTVGATSSEPGKLGLYDGGDKLIGTLEADFTNGALTQTLTVSVQNSVTTGTLKISDSAGNFAADTQGVILGTGGNDTTITGTADDDFIYGFGGDDVVTGGDGNDMIIGGGGADELSGGAGKDTFVFSSPATNGTDTILGFEVGTGGDILDFSGILGEGYIVGEYVKLNGTETNTEMGSGGEDILVFTTELFNTASSLANDFTIGKDLEASNEESVRFGNGAEKLFIFSNGSSAHVWHWQDTDYFPGRVNSVELTQIATLEGINSVTAGDFVGENFNIA